MSFAETSKQQKLMQYELTLVLNFNLVDVSEIGVKRQRKRGVYGE